MPQAAPAANAQGHAGQVPMSHGDASDATPPRATHQAAMPTSQAVRGVLTEACSCAQFTVLIGVPLEIRLEIHQLLLVHVHVTHPLDGLGHSSGKRDLGRMGQIASRLFYADALVPSCERLRLQVLHLSV